MIYLDTHVVAWLYAGRTDLLPDRVRVLIEENDLYISPVVLLELQYLKEIGRITAEPGIMLESVSASTGLRTCGRPFLQVVSEAVGLEWTRDPFDRLIVAAAASANAPLVTKDRVLLDNYSRAVWE